MKLEEGVLRLSATDLAQHLGCRHLTQLDRAAAEGEIEAPIWTDPIREMLIERGRQHEAAFGEHLAAGGRSVVDVGFEGGVDQVAELMRAGTDVITQAPLATGRFRGFADFLLKVDQPSDLGNHAYEVADTKLAQETRAGTLLQLCLYSEALGALQGVLPEWMHVVKPGEGFERESFRFADFGAYYRLVKGRLAALAEGPPAQTYPVPVAQCQVCRWWRTCDERLRADDSLHLVAGMTRLHAVELERQQVATLARCGVTPRLAEAPARGSRPTYERLHHQARVQLEARQAGADVYELLPLEEGRGLRRLPAPSPGDVFFDIEAARFYGDGGLEYLLGWCVEDRAGGLAYEARWARTRGEERAAFEAFLDVVMARWADDPGMHVYHFAPYEPTALKRLMGRHGTRGAELDRLLRGQRLVDLHAVAKQGVRASVERYSLKELERFAGYERQVDLREASRARRRIEAQLDLRDLDGLGDADLGTVEGYNREDCEATAALRDWLELRRAEWIDRDVDLPRPEPASGDPSVGVVEQEGVVEEVRDALTRDLPEDRDVWTDAHRATWLLAETLAYHRREHNCAHWEYYRVHDLDEDGLRDERKAVMGLEFVGEQHGGTARCPVHRYRYPDQECALAAGDALHEVGLPEEGDFGTVVAIDPAAGTLDVKKRQRARDLHPAAAMTDQRIRPWVKANALLAVARAVAATGIEARGPHAAARDLLLRRPPRIAGHAAGPLRGEGEPLLDAARRLAAGLDESYLPLQGPPGSGKTYTGARVVVALAAAGKRCGVTAVSHKVIRNLLEEILVAAREAGVDVRVAHKPSARAGRSPDEVVHAGSPQDALALLDEPRVVGGTAWLWSRDDAEQTLDYLFVDEAGQMALADVLAVSRAARNVVLLGDPQQLEQPQQGAHPEGTDAAALVHALDGHQTVPPERGLFLDETWRLHPDVCAFTSELYYEARLRARPENAGQVIGGPTRLVGSGLRHVPVEHEGNQSSAPEEVAAVRALIGDLLEDGVTWTDRYGQVRPLTERDVLIVAPYNAQVSDIGTRLPGARVGTVDRFQGQQAPVVIVSMTTSAAEEAPRGMEFLYSANRLNVATSRARCACIVVASPRLLEPECRTPREMQLANAFCRYLEMSRTVSLDRLS